jgi:hypothetical protein
MADTQRTLSAILALLADNTGQAISPQDLRDAIVSLFANYGMIYVHGGTTAQASITTSVLLTCFSSDGANGAYAGCVTPDKANNKVTVSLAGTYLVFGTVSIDASAAADHHFHVMKNGATELEELSSDLTIAATNTAGEVAFMGLIALAAADYVQVYVEAASSSNVTVLSSQFGMVKVG